MRRSSCCAIPSCAAAPVVIGGGRGTSRELQRRRHARASPRCATTSAAASSPPAPTRRARSASSRRWAMMKSAAARARRDAAAGRLRRVPASYSRLFKAAVREIAPIVEDRGIDEIYIDLSDVPGAQRRRRPRASAAALKAAVRERTGLTCSIGITPNKLLVEARLRARQARRPDAARPRRHPGAHLAARRAQGQRHRPEGRGQARRRSASRRSATSPPPSRRSCCSTSARASAPGCTRPSHGRDERAGRDLQRAEVDQPRDDLRARPARGARPRRAGRDLHRAVRAARRRPGAQVLRGQDHRHQAALRRLPDRDARPHACRRTRSTPREIRRAAGALPEARRPVAAAAPASACAPARSRASPTWSRRSPLEAVAATRRPPPRASRSRAGRRADGAAALRRTRRSIAR